MRLTPEQMKTFVVVAEQGSLAQAATILNRTPSAISMSLKQFTATLGKPLFETDRKSTLTPFGQFVLVRSRKALDALDDSMALIQRYARGDHTSLKIACVPSFSTHFLPAIVKTFSQAMPNVFLEIRDMDSALINQTVANDEVDLGIASRWGQVKALQADLVMEERFGIVCEPNHAMARHRKIALKQINAGEFIANGLIKSIEHTAVKALVGKSALSIHNIASLFSFIEQGFGVTLLPRSAVPVGNKLVFIPLNETPIYRRLYIMRNRKAPFHPAAEKFKAMVLASTKVTKAGTAT